MHPSTVFTVGANGLELNQEKPRRAAAINRIFHVRRNDTMNRTHHSRFAPHNGPARAPLDPLHEVTGLLWSSLLGGTFWILVIALVLSH